MHLTARPRANAFITPVTPVKKKFTAHRFVFFPAHATNTFALRGVFLP
jgi:hypothetical protein